MNLDNNLKSNQSQFYRFQLFQAERNTEGKFENKKTVGMAYLKEGQNIYSLRLWMLLNERYFIITTKNDASKYLILTRELNKNPLSKKKYFWNIVGNGKANTEFGVIELYFDLLEKTICMNLFPESQALSLSLSDPVEVEKAA